MIQDTLKLRFAGTQREFTTTLNKRVNEYFKSNSITKHANSEMVIKTIFMFTLYFTPYLFILTGVVTNTWLTLLCVVLMGLGLAGIGLAVMHDANHGAYAKKGWINSVIGYSINLLGASSFNWKIQHNVLHHSYTNVHEADEDISPRGVLRLEPHSPWKMIHRFQHIYAWFLYGLMTIVWLGFKDFQRLYTYQKNGLMKAQHGNSIREWTILIITKITFILYAVIIPILVTSWLWWQVLIGVFILHYIAGFILAIIFQPAHVIEGTAYPLPDDTHTLEDNWVIHQLKTTTNFSNNSVWFSWYVGGLNFQIEHHLFPSICHVHYKSISRIVRSTAEEFNLPYKTSTTFFAALRSHSRLLKTLGKKPSTSFHPQATI